MILRTIVTAGFAACVLALSSAVALAAPMTVTSDATLRDGNNNPIGTVPSGSTFDVEYCSGDFCFGTGAGKRGWIAQSQLQGGASPQPPPPPPQRPQNPFPGFNFDFDFGYGSGPNVPYPRPGQPNRPPRPDRPSRDAEVCFFEQPNFRGRSFCVEAGESDRSLSRRWNDSISSVSVERGLSVTVCRDRNFRGGCAQIDDDIRRLNRFDDEISSFRVSR